MNFGKGTRAARVLASAVVVALAAGIATATAAEPATSTVETFGRSTQSLGLAASRGLDGSGVTVAVIDSGVADVPGLDGRLVHQQNISAAPASGDQYGHGTFVAGLVHQVAPDAQIVSVKLSGANGSVDVTQVIAALQWVVLNKERFSIDVVNLSFGNDSTQSTHVSPLNYAVQRAWDAGIVVVASAGNAGDQPGTVSKPGDDPLAISVGATDEWGTGEVDDDTIPSFVSRGPTRDGLAKPDLVAPGTRVVSLRAPGSTVDEANPAARIGSDHFRGSGTSFAAPIVSGLVAQLLGAAPTATPDEVKYALLAGAQPVTGDPAAQGAGTARVRRALDLLGSGLANGGARRSDGTGSVDGARGNFKVTVTAPIQLLGGTIGSTVTTVAGERTGEVPPPELAPALNLLGGLTGPVLDPFQRGEFLDPAAWEASQWGASQWGASQWGASQWGASQWGASQWGSSQWWASQWG